ncbi:endosialidase catalytic beta-propeller domain-containing protein, partial [Escherichia coli]
MLFTSFSGSLVSRISGAVHNVHHSNLPFAKVGDELIIFGSERAFGEWEGGEPDNRYAG